MKWLQPENLQDPTDSCGVRDVFVLRRVEDDRFVHVGGAGRGEGWAGLAELRLTDNAAAREAHDDNRVVELAASGELHVFGPYWSRWAAFVPVDHDVMVIFGGAETAGRPATAEVLERTAAAAAREINVVAPAKLLADELEILHAVKKLMAAEPAGVVEALQHIVDCATEALSCEFGITWLRDDASFVSCNRGWLPDVPAIRTTETLQALTRAENPPICIQNSSQRTLPAPFRTEDGVLSYYLLPLGGGALMLLVHTRAQPRGFTNLCQELGRRLAEAGEILLRTATQRESLTRELERVSIEARRDPLTGLANRLAWEERLDALTEETKQQPSGLIYIDLDKLKEVNDKLGHDAGDRFIQAMAEIVCATVRQDDFVARLGGDEIAVLLPDTALETCSKVVNQLNAAASAHPGIDGYPIRFTQGFAVCKPGGNVHDALREADAALIRSKRSR